ncbi:MAG: copper oxidase, partial [Nitrosopumilaceae archaeon]
GHWISSDGKYVVTPDFMSLSSTITNLEDNTAVKAKNFTNDSTLILAPIATGMLGNTEDRKYYTADFLGNTLTVIDPENAEIVKQIDLLEVGAGLPIQTPVSPDDKWELTANLLGPAGASITIVDTSIDEIVATLQCDPGCHGVQWGAKDDNAGGYYAYVSSKFSNALIVVDPDPNNDGDGMDAAVVGKVILADRSVDSDDRVIGYDGMGGQGVLAIPNVYDGWIQQTVDACGPTYGNSHIFHEDPCSEEIADYLSDLSPEQLNPLE